MAHFALLDENNKVINVIVVVNAVIIDPVTGLEDETLGQDYLHTLFGPSGVWMQTSYNKTIRKNYAVIGGSYDATRDAFIPPHPYPSWLLDEATCTWVPPVPCPTDQHYMWDEATLNWIVPPANTPITY